VSNDIPIGGDRILFPQKLMNFYISMFNSKYFNEFSLSHLILK